MQKMHGQMSLGAPPIMHPNHMQTGQGWHGATAAMVGNMARQAQCLLLGDQIDDAQHCLGCCYTVCCLGERCF